MTDRFDVPLFSTQERDQLIAGSLEWLSLPINQMFASLKGGRIAEAREDAPSPRDLGVLYNASPAIDQPAPQENRPADDEISAKAPAYLLETLARKANAYLMGEEGQYRLTLIDQQDYDILVTELGRYKAEIDAHDTVLSFLEAHLGHLYGRKFTRESNPYSLYNLAFFILEGLGDLKISRGIRRGLLRGFLDQVVPDMQSNLWGLANRLEPLAKQTRLGSTEQPVSRHSPGSHYRGETPAGQQAGSQGAYQAHLPVGGNSDFQAQAQAIAEKLGNAPHRPLEQLLEALESFSRHASTVSTTPVATPQSLARWASSAPMVAEAMTLQSVRAASLVQHLPGAADASQAGVLSALSPVIMKTVAENSALLDDPHHPLRILLNRASEIVAAGLASKETEQLRQWAESAGRGLLQQPGDTRRWLTELDKLGASALIRRQERVLELQLEMEGWHRMLRARQRADETLARALNGKNLLREAAAFCDGPWRHVLAMIALRHNPGTQVWQDAQNAVTSFTQLPLAEEDLLQLRQIVSREMHNFFSVPETELAEPRWLDQLSHPLLPELGMSWLNQTKSPGATPPQTDGAVDLELGAWVRFADKTEWPYPLQLVWTSLPYGWFGFADTAGHRSFRMEKAELLAHLERRRVERFGWSTFDKLPALVDLNIQSWPYEDQLLSTLRDSETGFLNRRGLIQSLNASAAAGEERWQATVIDFPNLAGRYAHSQQAGDAVLADVSKMLRTLGRPGLLIARIADTRFVLASPEPGEGFAREVELLASQSMEKSGETRFAIGCCPEAPAGEEMLRFAEQACVAAWEQGSQQVRVNSYLQARGEDWMRAVTRLMGENRLVPFVQPMRALRKDLPGHGEVLIRLKSEDGKYLSPAIFLREAERQKLITRVDHWVLREVCSWLVRHELPEGVESLSVNLSGQTLSDPDSLQEIQNIIDNSGVKPEKLIFEVTETIAVLDAELTRQFLSQIRERGCRTALDDFGTGYANYSYLRQMPFDYLKIDGSFIRELLKNESDQALVKFMCDAARNLGISSIAEYVHDEAMFPLLTDLGVDYAQGYAVSEPMPLANLFEEASQGLTLQKLALSSS